MKKEYRWEDLVAKIMNFLVVIVFLPIKGLWWLLKRITTDIGKNAYGRFVAFAGLIILLSVFGFLLR